MEFLIARLPDHANAGMMELGGPWPQISTLDGPAQAAHYKDFLLIGPNAGTFFSQTTTLFDGHATIDGEAISSGDTKTPSAKILEKLLLFSKGEKHYSGLSGVFVLVQMDAENGCVEIFCDPLSQYNLFYTNAFGATVYSNSIYLIEALYRRLRHPLERSPSVAAYEASLGFGGGLGTGLKQVSLIPVDHCVRLSLRQPTAQHIRANHLSAPGNTQRVSSEVAAESMAMSVSGLHNSFQSHDIVYDLTGGFDSRLVFAASRKAGQENQLIFRSDGGPAHDVRIPDYIAQHYHLNYAGFPENFDGETLTALEFAKRAVFRQQGQSSIYCHELGRYRVSGVCRVRGGVGEMLRAVYHRNYNKGFRWKAKRAFDAIKNADLETAKYSLGLSGHPVLPSGANVGLIAQLLTQNLGIKGRFFTRSFRHSITQNVADQLATLVEIDVEEDALLSGLYLTDRSRRHYGYASQALNVVRPTFDPLSNIDLWRFASSYSMQERANGNAVYDLMMSLDPSLLNVPYASSPFDKSTLGFKVFDGDFPDAIKPEAYPIKSVRQPKMRDAAGKIIAVPYNHQAHIEPHRDLFFDLLFSLRRSDDVWNILDCNAFEELFRNPDRDEIISENALMFKRLFYGLIWVLSLEDDTPINRSI